MGSTITSQEQNPALQRRNHYHSTPTLNFCAILPTCWIIIFYIPGILQAASFNFMAAPSAYGSGLSGCVRSLGLWPECQVTRQCQRGMGRAWGILASPFLGPGFQAGSGEEIQDEKSQ